MLVDAVIEDPRWEAADVVTVAERASRAALDHLAMDPDDFEISVLACDDARIAGLNAQFRTKPVPTNVLSWPAVGFAPGPGANRVLPPGGNRVLPHDAPPPGPKAAAHSDPELGDIAIAYDTCAREAQEQQKPFADHVTHLIVHATLHLLGYDHETDTDATEMEALETEILGNLGHPDPYAL